MLGTNDLHQLTLLADTQRWRLVLVGDPRQLQAVGRGGLFNELVTGSGRSHQLETIHRFNHPWEAAASLALGIGDHPRPRPSPWQGHGTCPGRSVTSSCLGFSSATVRTIRRVPPISGDLRLTR